nr:hypothetical protein [Tanacetum cinerariifolium]
PRNLRQGLHRRAGLRHPGPRQAIAERLGSPGQLQAAGAARRVRQGRAELPRAERRRQRLPLPGQHDAE